MPCVGQGPETVPPLTPSAGSPSKTEGAPMSSHESVTSMYGHLPLRSRCILLNPEFGIQPSFSLTPQPFVPTANSTQTSPRSAASICMSGYTFLAIHPIPVRPYRIIVPIRGACYPGQHRPRSFKAQSETRQERGEGGWYEREGG